MGQGTRPARRVNASRRRLRSLVAMGPIDRSRDLPTALVLAVVTFLVFAGLVAGIITDTFPPVDAGAAWVGAGIVGLACAALVAWALVLHFDAEMTWAERVGGDLLLVGVAVALLFVGLPTFVAGML
jgi:hypothetical protein